jgi:hypothetical protein
MLKNELNKTLESIALINRFDTDVTDTPPHVNTFMQTPNCGIAATDFGVHNWCRPIENGGDGYFLNIGHNISSTTVPGFDGDGIFAKQYKVENGDWKIEPFMASNPEDLVTKKYLLSTIDKLEQRIKDLESKL